MMKWKKSEILTRVHYGIRGEALQAAEKLQKSGVDVLHLNIGNTLPFGLEADAEVLETVKAHLSSAQGYVHSKGLVSSRESIVQYYEERGISLTVDDVYIGNGVSELIVSGMRALLNNDDEVLVPSPDYPLWSAAINLSGGKAVYYTCDVNNDWQPDIDNVVSCITPKTKAIVIINPNNPTGAVYSTQMLKKIVEIAQANDILIFSDEIYEQIVYDDAKGTVLATLTGDYPCIFFNGLSKSKRAPGFRAGWMCIHDPHNMLDGYRDGMDVLMSMRLCANVPAQLAIPTALQNSSSIHALVNPGGRLFEQRAILCQCLDGIDGLTYVKPKGALYAFPQLDVERFSLHNSKQFVLDFLHDKHVLLVPGTSFNYHIHEGTFRIVFLPASEMLKNALDRLKEFLSTYHQVS